MVFSVVNHGQPWDVPWVPMGVHGCSSLLATHGYPWVSSWVIMTSHVDNHGIFVPWVSMGSHGSTRGKPWYPTWIAMGVPTVANHGYPWSPPWDSTDGHGSHIHPRLFPVGTPWRVVGTSSVVRLQIICAAYYMNRAICNRLHSSHTRAFHLRRHRPPP